jgi:hypothetical protein
MARMPLETIVEARIADYRERALSNYPRRARHQRTLLVWNRHHQHPQANHAAGARLARTSDC